jgi:tRNA A-37 threonylcarbamoyl transferase component Bud32
MSQELGIDAVVAGYRIESLIGEGAMGTVYLAEASDGKSRVALKLLPPSLAEDERYRRRFLRETEIAASLDHPNIVRTLGSGDENGRLYLALAYVEGSDLRELLTQGRLEPGRAIAIVAQVADALDAAHAAGLVHRDVKPGNILVAGEGGEERAYVCDFGLARHVSSVSSLTTDRGFVGTIDYVPPEQIEGGTIDGRADVYSLGCVLYECLSGRRPFDRESELSIVFAHLNEPPPRLSDVREDAPEAFDDVFATALAKHPKDRYSTCSELAYAARAALQGKTVRRPSRRRRLLLAGAVLAAGGAVAGAAIAERGGAGSDSPTPPKITESSIAGARLGHPGRYYKNLLGGWRAEELTQVHYQSLAFQQPEIAVYFPARGKPAHIITTWNRDYTTAKGIGPCSTLAAMKNAYGGAAKPTWAGTSPDGKQHWSWALGRNLLFVTQDHRTIANVVLYKGLPVEKHGRSPQDYANFVGADETACK